ncbi:MAG: ATP synthase F1 subunit epsilon [Planctomycetota bacterium]|nr:ATP synthase F1 subunit epsilon [Planctomycetota bacterium]
MGGELTLRVITPDRIVFDETASSVTIPALDGSIGILPRHAPMVAALDTGVLSFVHEGEEKHAFVSGGFAEVRGDTVRLVTQAGELADEIDEQRVRQAEERASERMEEGRASKVATIDLLRAEASLRRAFWRLRTRMRAGL